MNFIFLQHCLLQSGDDTAVRMPSSPGWNGACTAPTLVHSTDLYIRNRREKGLTYSFCLQNPFTVKKKSNRKRKAAPLFEKLRAEQPLQTLMGLHRNCCPHRQSQVLIKRKLVSTEQHAQPQLRAHSTGGITRKGTPLSPAPPRAEGDEVPMVDPGPPSWGQLMSSTGLPPASSPLVTAAVPFPPVVTSSHLQSR